MTVPGLESGSVPRNYGLRYATEMLQDGAILENREWQSIPARAAVVQPLGPGLARERLTEKKFSIRSVENIEERIAIGMKHELALLAPDGLSERESPSSPNRARRAA